MLIAILILLVLLMSGLAVVLVYALRADISIGRDSWSRLNRKQQRLQLVAIVAWFGGLAIGFGIGYAIGGNWQSGIGGAVVLAFGLAVIGPLVVLGVGRRA
jgi:hypothetical protein